jgi:uncharacterized protein
MQPRTIDQVVRINRILSDNPQNPIEQHFQELDGQLRLHFADVGLAEIHGMACAILCQGVNKFVPTSWHLLLGESAVNGPSTRVVKGIFDIARQCLSSDDFKFAPLLPGDDTAVSVRVEAVADWCNGFIQAWLAGTAPKLGEFAAEAITDIQSISELEPDERDDEPQRFSLFEVEHYLVAAVQLLYDETNPETPPSVTH